MEKLIKLEDINRIFLPLEKCRGVEQRDDYHPEGDVFVHSLQCLSHAFRESVDPELVLAAMLHDVGKIVDSKGHEKYACDILGDSVQLRTLWLINYHMRYYTYIDGEMRKMSKVKDFVSNVDFKSLAQLCRWDKMSRKVNLKPKYDRVYIVNRLNNLISNWMYL